LTRHGLGLGDLLRLEPVALEHVHEVHIPAKIELVRAVENHPSVLEQPRQDAVHDGRSDLALDVVPDDRHAGIGKTLRPLRITGDEHRDRVHESDAGLEASLGVVALRLLRADGEVGDENLGTSTAQVLGDVDRLGGRLLDHLAVVVAEPVERRPPLDAHAEVTDLRETDRVVLPGVNGLAEIEPDLVCVDVECGDELDVADVVVPEHDVHQAGYQVARVGVPVVLDTLHERARAVADAGDGHLDRTLGAHWSLLGSGLSE
jgi:hypothetical protein